MSHRYETGNVKECWTIRDGLPTYWFVGHFLPENCLRKTDNFSCKWGIHQPEEEVQERLKEKAPLTISVLIQGQLNISIRQSGTDNWTEHRLEKPGDFVIWDPGIDHKYSAGAPDTTVFTVRKELLATQDVVEDLGAITLLSRSKRDSTSPVWDVSQERAFMETLCNQRFNFFLVFFGVAVAAMFNAKHMGAKLAVTAGAFIILFNLRIGLQRAYHKLDINIAELLHKDPSHPATVINNRAGDSQSARKLYSHTIPWQCLLMLIAIFFVTLVVWHKSGWK